MTRIIPFEFVENASLAETADPYLAYLPADLTSKDELLQALYERLQLPGYFGFNWDALSDCLRDFHWLEPRAIVLVHADLPGLPRFELRSYLDVLAEAVASWQAGDDHQFRAVFPRATKDAVSSVMG